MTGRMINIGPRRLILFLVSVSFVFSPAMAQSTQDEKISRTILEHRKEQEKEFRNKKKSPLEKKDIRKFKGLNYYPINLAFHVKARLVKDENPEIFKMKTTTTRLPEYARYGIIYFTLNGKEYSLEVYQNQELLKRPEYKDYLFIPFSDETNGKETYDIGRFLDFKIPDSEDVYLDFNLCYNPLCSYSHRFSCPIPPAQNHLPIAIEAGEKKYKNDH